MIAESKASFSLSIRTFLFARIFQTTICKFHAYVIEIVFVALAGLVLDKATYIQEDPPGVNASYNFEFTKM